MIDRRWMLAPPALALLLMLGPLGPGSTTSLSPDDGASAPEATTELLQAMLPAAVVLALLAAGAFVLSRRNQRPAENGGLVRRQSMRLSPRASLHVVEFDGKTLLIGESQAGVALVESQSATGPAEERVAVSVDDDGTELRDTRPERTVVLPRPPREPVAQDFSKLLRKAGQAVGVR